MPGFTVFVTERTRVKIVHLAAAAGRPFARSMPLTPPLTVTERARLRGLRRKSANCAWRRNSWGKPQPSSQRVSMNDTYDSSRRKAPAPAPAC